MMLGVLLPLWISVLVRSFAWITLLRNRGVINNALMGLGVIDSPLALMWNELGIVIGMVHYMLPFGILPLLANMRRINPALVAAARGLGASRTEAFWRVFLPLSTPGIIAATILVFIFSLGFFVTPALLGGGRTILITEYISVQIVELLRWGTGTMLATMLIVIVFALFGLLARVVDLRQVFGAK
jgi:putative spermidine/putrescine transport system permease protein